MVILSGKLRKEGGQMKIVIRKSAKKKRALVNSYGEKKKNVRGTIPGGPKLSSSRLTEGFPVRGNRA